MDAGLADWRRARRELALRIEALIREVGDVGDPGEVRLAARVQAADPAPAERVRCRIAVDEMPEEEVRAELPWQPQRKYPDAGEPHPRMIMQVSSLGQLVNPRVETVDARVAACRRGVAIEQPRVCLETL